jgi:hypothetical protein
MAFVHFLRLRSGKIYVGCTIDLEQRMPASFFQKTSAVVPGVERVHHLIEGIYKPAPFGTAAVFAAQFPRITQETRNYF